MSQGTLVATAALHFYVILWIPVSSGAGHCRSGVSMDGNALIGYTFASFLVNSPFECAVKCENEPRCQSYNYVIAGKVCELNNRTKEAKPAQLINDPDRFYMTKWADRVPLGSIPELPGESCSEIKASEGVEAKSAVHWLDPKRTGSSIRVFCDMINGVADFCFEHQCQNNGTCVNGAVGYTCLCESVWIGNWCDIECKAALGMEDYSIPSSSIQASSHKDATLEPSNGRIHNSNGGGSWSAAVNDEHQWFQVDFENWAQVSGISTQGRLGYAEWVKTYRVSYSYDGLLYADYKEEPEAKVFVGNNDQSTVVHNDLKEGIVTRFIRIHPITYSGWMSFRTEFHGCKAGPRNMKCFSPLGMESGRIPDQAIVASSRDNQYRGPERGRLNLKQNGYECLLGK